MREIRLSGSEGGGTGNSTGSPYPYPPRPCSSVGAGHARDKKGIPPTWSRGFASPVSRGLRAGWVSPRWPMSCKKMVRTANPTQKQPVTHVRG